MRVPILAALLLGAFLLGSCQSPGDAFGDIGASFGGSAGRDTYGTNRRMDVYGGATAPSLPSIGAPGFGK